LDGAWYLTGKEGLGDNQMKKGSTFNKFLKEERLLKKVTKEAERRVALFKALKQHNLELNGMGAFYGELIMGKNEKTR
jgi:hypothetical protein